MGKGPGTALAKGKGLVKHGHKWIGRFPWAVTQRRGTAAKGAIPKQINGSGTATSLIIH